MMEQLVCQSPKPNNSHPAAALHHIAGLGMARFVSRCCCCLDATQVKGPLIFVTTAVRQPYSAQSRGMQIYQQANRQLLQSLGPSCSVADLTCPCCRLAQASRKSFLPSLDEATLQKYQSMITSGETACTHMLTHATGFGAAKSCWPCFHQFEQDGPSCCCACILPPYSAG